MAKIKDIVRIIAGFIGVLLSYIYNPRDNLTIILLHDTPKYKWPQLKKLLIILQRKYRFISPHEAEHGGIFDGSSKKPCLLTFDDGFKSNLHFARNVLDELNISALFFICPDIMDLRGEKLHEAITCRMEVDIKSDLINWDDVAELISIGHDIGSHTNTHQRLNIKDGNILEYEIGQSSKKIESKIGKKVKWFAFPFGNLDSITPESVAYMRKHYSYYMSGIRGCNASGIGNKCLYRQSITLDKNIIYQIIESLGGFDFWHRKSRQELEDIEYCLPQK